MFLADTNITYTKTFQTMNICTYKTFLLKKIHLPPLVFQQLRQQPRQQLDVSRKKLKIYIQLQHKRALTALGNLPLNSGKSVHIRQLGAGFIRRPGAIHRHRMVIFPTVVKMLTNINVIITKLSCVPSLDPWQPGWLPPLLSVSDYACLVRVFVVWPVTQCK